MGGVLKYGLAALVLLYLKCIIVPWHVQSRVIACGLKAASMYSPLTTNDRTDKCARPSYRSLVMACFSISATSSLLAGEHTGIP